MRERERKREREREKERGNDLTNHEGYVTVCACVYVIPLTEYYH